MYFRGALFTTVSHFSLKIGSHAFEVQRGGSYLWKVKPSGNVSFKACFRPLSPELPLHSGEQE